MKRQIALLSVAALALAAFVPAIRAQTYTYSTASTAVYNPGGVALDSSGAIFVSTFFGGTIYKLSPSGAVLAQFGSGAFGSDDGTGTGARFYNPSGLALDAAGNLYVADKDNSTIRKITPAGVVSTLAGLARNAGPADGTGAAARFNAPRAVVVDSAGNVFVADGGNHAIRKITPAGVVTTIAGSLGSAGSSDGTGPVARFSNPQGIAIDSAGNLFVADTNNHSIRRITPAGVVTTVAGLAGSHGSLDGAGLLARFFYPQGIAVDSAGTVFVGDTTNFTIRKITSGGSVTTIGGLAGFSSDSAGIGSTARFYGTRAITFDTTGNLIIADGYLKLGVSSSQLAITMQPQSMSVGIGSTARLSVTATGAAPITFQWQKDGAAIAGATSSTLTLTSVTSAGAGTYTITATNPVGTLASTGAVLAVVAAVPNDDFANATPITGSNGQVSGSNNGATGELGEPTHSVPSAVTSSIWYKWIAPETGTAVLTISASGFSTGQVAWTGGTLATLTRVASSSGNRLVFRAQGGTSYHIAIGSTSTAARGNITLAWQMILNDDFANAQTLSGNSGSVSARNDGATTETGEQGFTLVGSNSVWFRWTPSESGVALFDVPVGLDVRSFTGDTLPTLTSALPWSAIQANVNGVFRWRLHFNAIAGTTYRIVVATNGYYSGPFNLGWQISSLPVIIGIPGDRTVQPGTTVTLQVNSFAVPTPSYQWLRNGTPIIGATSAALTIPNAQASDSGSYVLRITNTAGSIDSTPGNLTVLVPPANDNFANAAALAGLTGSVTGTNVNATGETGEPAHWNLSGTASSVWYRWTASATGLAAIDTVGSNFDTVLAIYTGSTLSSLNRLTQDDDRGGGRTSLVSFSATAGTVYYIAVGGSTSGARGNIRLNWQLTAILAITTQPVAQTIAAGGSATLTVAASAASATYQWFRNGTIIPGATTSTLTISNVAVGTDASYTVNVTASGVTVTSAPASLAVSAPLLTTFSLRHTRADANLLWSIAAGNGQMVAVGSLGVILSSADNGRTWTNRASGTNGWLVAVTFGNGQFVVVGEGGTILTSPDGATWTAAPGTATTERLNNILYADGKYVAIGEKGTAVTSVDGNVWTLRSTPVTTWLHGLTYHAGIRHFAACGDAGVFLYSADAITWNRLPVPGYTGALQHTVAVDSYSHFVAVGEQGKVISVRQNQLVLKDGEPLTTWTAEANSTNTTSHLIGLVQGAGALFASSADGQIITAANDRGPWFSLPSNATGYLLAGLYHNNTLYVVGERENIIQSEPIYATRLINISTRGQVGTGGDIMISGFIVRGTTPKKVLVRAAGPALTGFGLAGQLAAPVLTLLNANGQPLAINSGWNNATNRSDLATTAAAVGAFPFAAASLDSAILTTLDPGNYTAQIAGANGTTGLAIVEAYDVDPLSVETSRAINVSTRGLVGTGANKMIAGFVINGSASRRVLIRAVGPGLAAFGVPGTLAEPQLELYTSRGLLQTSAGAWGLQANADEIRGAAQVSGAFALAEGSKDSAMVVTLLPGAWTVQVGGANSTTGVAIVEAYVLP